MKLDLSNGDLTEFDGTMYPRLTHLDVSYNKIRKITNCPNLISLNARWNMFTRFDLDCPKLAVLKLEGNQLEYFVGNYPHLIKLKLDDNILRHITGRFPSLLILTATYNNLSTLDASCPALRSLELNHNPLLELDTYVRLPNLEYLNLTGCNIHVHVSRKMKKIILAAEVDVLGGSIGMEIIARSYY
jgi:Leucine-rich repeat (LRR) protein